MRVWLLQIGETLPLAADIRKLRTLLLAERLAERGHSVLWWGSTFDHFTKQWIAPREQRMDYSPGVQLQLLRGRGYRRNVSLSRILDHRLIARRFRTLAPLQPSPDLILASMPTYDLAFESVLYAAARQIPVLIDIRDQWPDIFLDPVPSPLRPLARALLAWEFHLLKATLRGASGITSMMEALLRWGLCYVGRERTWRDRVFYLGHQEGGAEVDDRQVETYRRQFGDSFVVLFIGTFGSYHHPATLVEAARRLTGKNILFVIAGDGERRGELQRLAAPLDNVIFPGWVKQREINALLKLSHVGVCPASQPALFLPNKAFLYFSAGLPVCSAFQGDMQYILETMRVGLYYPPNDATTLADHIERLKNDPGFYATLSQNARRAFQDHFDADAIYPDFVRHIEAVQADAQPNIPIPRGA